MYVMHKRERVVHLPDGGTRTEPGETRTFKSGAEMLRWAIRNGVVRDRFHRGRTDAVVRLDDIYLGRAGQRTYGLASIDTFSRWEVTYEHIEAMRRAQARYAEIVHYVTEVEPEWRPDTSVSATGEVHYADNSVELHEVDKRGKRRHRMVQYPSGDVCF